MEEEGKGKKGEEGSMRNVRKNDQQQEKIDREREK